MHTRAHAYKHKGWRHTCMQACPSAGTRSHMHTLVCAQAWDNRRKYDKNLNGGKSDSAQCSMTWKQKFLIQKTIQWNKLNILSLSVKYRSSEIVWLDDLEFNPKQEKSSEDSVKKPSCINRSEQWCYIIICDEQLVASKQTGDSGII